MASVKLILKKNKARPDGTAPLYVRLTHRRRSRYQSLKVWLLPEQWNQDQQRVKKAHPFSTRMNALLAQKRAEFEELAVEIRERNANLHRWDLRGLMDGAAGASFFEHAFAHVRNLTRRGSHGAATNFELAIRQFRDWLQKHKQQSDLSFAAFTAQLGHEFRDYLQSVQGNHPNTIKAKFVPLRRVMNLAHRDGIISEAQNTLRRVLTPGKRTRKVIPSAQDMARIEALELESESTLWHVRNMYLFSARMAGLRFSDVITLSWANVQGEHLQWRTRKTDKQLRLIIPPHVAPILEHYREECQEIEKFIFPPMQGHESLTGKALNRKIVSANSSVNKGLGKLCRMANLPRSYSFHTARHFFATQALRKGMRVELLREILTHSTLEQTMQYVRIVDNDLDEAMLRISI